ncbi:hypothetical protein V7S43_004473 [Phytophthora oleae]|uniref:HAT C-terminal dimerisation domain-containing protein n=1 Tax=Phytophthora oleae TaxID=2107226 RepID=A0ABD3FTF0_9STRA
MSAFTLRQAPPLVRAQDIMDSRIDDEIENWFEDQSVLETKNGRPESVLQYWKRQYEMKTYRFLPLVARIVFAVPSSSAQIERDFGNSGQTVTALRSSTSSHNIDMCSFLSQNRRFVDVCQCPKLQHHEVYAHIPSNVIIDLDSETKGRVDLGTVTQECFSLSLSDTEGGA